MPTIVPQIVHDVTSPDWGSDCVWVYDIMNFDISCSKIISGYRQTDKYDNLGRNITAQERRQVLVPWITPNKVYKRFNLERPANVYDKFQFKLNDEYVWSERNQIYSTISIF